VIGPYIVLTFIVELPLVEGTPGVIGGPYIVPAVELGVIGAFIIASISAVGGGTAAE
jgi:hypothetical protein